MSDITITKPDFNDFDEILPILASKAFYDRFHNEGKIEEKFFDQIIDKENLKGNKFFDSLTKEQKLELAGSLSTFKELRPSGEQGQSYTSFQNYYKEARKKFQDGTFYIWVAKKDNKIALRKFARLFYCF